MWREHAIETAKVLSAINPEFIRVRTMSINSRMPLYADVESGSFVRETDEEIVEEERLLIENLECNSSFVSDHITNLLQEVEGQLPQDKGKMLAIISRFQDLTPEKRTHFKIGRRVGIYTRLDDLNDISRREAVERVIQKITQDGTELNEELLYGLMQGFIV